MALLGKCGLKCCVVLTSGAAWSTGRVVITNDGCAGVVVWTNVGAVGSSDVRVDGSDAEDDMACSTSIRAWVVAGP
uniref:Secreted protein n=1 Tax=Romanomermis culicivorax TaxID=13658 RepID=A0A915JX12_ROMCU